MTMWGEESGFTAAMETVNCGLFGLGLSLAGVIVYKWKYEGFKDDTIRSFHIYGVLGTRELILLTV